MDVTEKTREGRRDSTPHAPRVNAFLFLVLSGSRLADGGARLVLDGELVIGRGDKRARKGSQLTVADGRMSGTHAKIDRTDEGWFVEDAGSTNGTAVNGQDVKRAKLADGDVIELGQTLFLFREVVGEKAGDLGSSDISRPAGFATLDPELAKKLARLERVAASNLSVLLIGETGTGCGVGLAWLASGAGPGTRLVSVERDLQPHVGRQVGPVAVDRPDQRVAQRARIDAVLLPDGDPQGALAVEAGEMQLLRLAPFHRRDVADGQQPAVAGADRHGLHRVEAAVRTA